MPKVSNIGQQPLPKNTKPINAIVGGVMVLLLLLLASVPLINRFQEREEEGDPVSIEHASDAQIAAVRTEINLQNSEKVPPPPHIGGSSPTLVTIRSNGTLTLKLDQQTKTERFFCDQGTNTFELKAPWLQCIEFVLLTNRPQLGVFHVTSAERRPQIVVARISPSGFVQTLKIDGFHMRSDNTATNIAYFRQSDPLSVIFKVHCLNPISHEDNLVITIREGDPGSGTTFDYLWLQKSRTLYISGHAISIGGKRLNGEFQLIYDPAKKELLQLLP